MKVFINVGPHPQYREIVDYPPKGVSYEVKGASDASRYYSSRTNGLRKKTNSIIKILGVPRMTYYRTDADVIFSTRGIIPLNPAPWVLELEHPYAFVGMDYKNWGIRQKFLVKRFLSMRNCRFIMPNSNGALIALKRSFDAEEIEKKIRLVYLAVHYKKIKKIRHTGINILTISNEIYGRGFNVIKDMYVKLKRKHPEIRWIIKTRTRFLQRDVAFIKKSGIEVINGILSDAQMDELFGIGDIFLYPSLVDINAMVVNEAMRAGLPLITTDTFGFKDKVFSYKNGITIHDPGVFWNSDFLRTGYEDFYNFHNEKMSNEAFAALDYLINHDRERKRMGEVGERYVRSGFLSVKERNKKLKAIFEEAVKNS
ncbi:glycosyltransferase [Candidatus Parvarchaeota archaeon]|nr:glycosyltransferase [Candidatus Parvarchaeota archaeon]